jgi:hypothetical protein
MSTQMRDFWEKCPPAAKGHWKAKKMDKIVRCEHTKMGRTDLIVRIKLWEKLGYWDGLWFHLLVRLDSDLDPDCVSETLKVIRLIKEKSVAWTIRCLHCYECSQELSDVGVVRSNAVLGWWSLFSARIELCISSSSKIWDIVTKGRLFASGINGVLRRYNRNKILIQGNLVEKR